MATKNYSPKFKIQLLLCAIILFFLLLFFYKEIILLQKNFLWDDVLYQWYPFLSFAKECFKRLKLPVWNPYVFSGMPFLNDIQSQTFYPINFFFFFLNGFKPLTYLQVELIVLFHLWLLGFSTFLLLKGLKLHWPVAILGGVLLTFSGFSSLRVIQLGPLAVFSWSPLILYFFIRLLQREKLADVTWGGIIFGISLLGGYPQFSLYLIYGLIIYYLVWFFFFKKKGFAKSFLKVILFFIIGLGICAIQYYPSFKYVPYTLRKSMTFAEATDGSLIPIQLLNIFIPKFFGSFSGAGSDTVPFWLVPFGYYYWESGIYLGILPIFLALFAIFFSARREKYIFLIIALLALLFALGENFPLYRICWQIIPGLNRFRIPARFLGVYTISMTILACLGLESVLKSGEQIRRNLLKFIKYLTIFLFFIFLVFLLFLAGSFKNLSPFFQEPSIWQNCQKQFGLFFFFLFLTWGFFFMRIKFRLKERVFVLIAGAIIFFDLYQFGNKFSQGLISPSEYYPYTSLVRQLQKEREKEFFRIKARENGYMVLKRNEGCLWKLELLEGYTPLSLERYIKFVLPEERKCELLNVKYKIKVDPIKKTMTLVLNEKYLPRAFLCYDWRVVKDEKEILALLASDTFDVRKTVILDEEVSTPPPQDFSFPSQIEITDWDIDYIKLRVKTDQAGFLVLSEIYYPEWQAKVNGKKTKIYKGNYALRSVFVPAGEHKIEFYYDKKNITIGSLITFFTLLLLSTFRLAKRKNKKPPEGYKCSLS